MYLAVEKHKIIVKYCQFYNQYNYRWCCEIDASFQAYWNHQIIPPTSTTHVKISHLVASLPTSRQQVVFALLVPSCQQVWNKLWTTCNKLVDIIRLVPTSPIQSWYNNIVTTLCRQPCNILVVPWLYQTCYNNLVTSLIMPSSLLQVVNSLFQTCYNNWEQAVRTQLVDSLWTDL